MSAPNRVQLSSKKGWEKPANTVVVSRPSKWGNPHTVGFCAECGVEHTQQEAVDEFAAMLNGDPFLSVMTSLALRGKNLACWCKPGTPCHADILLKIANAKP